MPKNLWIRITKGRETLLFFAGVFLLSTIFFKSSFDVFFSQDDYFHFVKSMEVNNLASFIKLFTFKIDNYGFYRPITDNVYFLLSQKIFKEKIFLYHFFNFSIFFASTYFVFKIFLITFRENKKALFASFIYAISSFHFTSLSYISAVEEIFAAFFFFLTVFCFLEKRRLGLIFFILALFSRESAVSLPLVVLLLELLEEKKAKRSLPYFLTLLAYLFLRLANGLFPDLSVYAVTFLPKTVFNNIFWYFLWGFGAPENLIDFTGPGFKFNSQFFAPFPLLTKSIIILLFTIVFLFLISCFRRIRILKNGKNFWLYILWFLISVLPFVFLTNHRFAFYLEIPFFGLAGLFTLLVYDSKKLRYLFLLLTCVLSFLTVDYYSKTYWAINRAKISQKLIVFMKGKYPFLTKGSIIYFESDKDYFSPSVQWGDSSTQAKIALSGCNGLRFFYNDSKLECYFESDQNPPGDSENVIKVKARLD